MSARGLFVVLEGIDGAGTTTQVERLAAALRAAGRRVLATREPSDGPVGMLIRQALAGRLQLPGGRGALSRQTLALLFAADRTDHLDAQIRPALEEGAVVLCDRYLLSSLAYQGSVLPPRWVEAINAWASPPDLTLFLEVEPRVASRRRAARGGEAELYEDDRLQRRVARRYLEVIGRRRRPDRVARIPGHLPVEEITARCLSEIRRRLEGPGRRGEARGRGERSRPARP